MHPQKHNPGPWSKGLILIGLCFLSGGLMSVRPALAATAGGLAAIQSGVQSTASGAQLNTSATDLPTIAGVIINSVMSLVGMILFGFMVYGGFRWMTAAGDAKAVTEAQSIMKNAVIGLVIIVLAYALTNYILAQLITAANTAPGAVQSTGVPATPSK